VKRPYPCGGSHRVQGPSSRADVGTRTGRPLRIAQAWFATFALGLLVLTSLPPHVYKKDLQVEYLTAWALRDGSDIFAPITELSARYFPAPTANFPHPSPYPPVLALLGVPLTFLPFPVIALLWLLLNVGLLVVIGEWLGLSVLGSLALAAWPPLWFMLFIGQLELVVLVLAMLGWRAAAIGRDWRAGVWLGVAAAIKLYPALFVVPFVVRRRGRVVLAAAAVVALAQVGDLLVAGRSGLWRYYAEILPSVSAHYVGIGLNSSPHGALLRLFGGATDVPPLISAPGAVAPATIALSVFALLSLARLDPEAAPVAVLVALPAAWYYYAVLALPQIVILLRSTIRRRAALAAIVAASCVLPLENLSLASVLDWFHWTSAPRLGAILTAVQPAGFLALLVLSVVAAGARRGSPVA
jgi:hypothetical protein